MKKLLKKLSKLIERELGIRVVYLKFEGFEFGWGLWLGCSIELRLYYSDFSQTELT